MEFGLVGGEVGGLEGMGGVGDWGTDGFFGDSLSAYRLGIN